MSAATLIFLSGDVFQITPHSCFMIHNYSGGMWGKGGEIYDQAVFERNWSKELLTQFYQGFLTDEELNAVLTGKDIWVDYKDLMRRCELLVKFRQDKKDRLAESA